LSQLEKQHSSTSFPLRAGRTSRMRAALGLLLIVLIYICRSPADSATQSPAPPRTHKEYRTLQSFLLNQTGEYVFHFRQAQSREVTLLLKVEGSTGEPDRQELTHLRATIDATLLDSRGRNVCRAEGPIEDGVGPHNWVLRTSRGEAAFWHQDCAALKSKGADSYTLTISLRQVDPKNPDIKVVPIFERSDDYGP
jgi:hypothetical protein